ncbi:hypothetical protein Dda_1555 [Drechslerella dactyloides]|uniref:Uncharacterized protein n=1 Tax=Drechslerella dactyloides TaxID=74499 RepID=A0AAD6J3A2_DREDA|nr:hypothetical protein Dda_1555 [Drechslerella dactyloides]
MAAVQWELINKLPSTVPRFDARTDRGIKDRLRINDEDIFHIKDVLDCIFENDKDLLDINFHDCTAAAHKLWRATVDDKLKKALEGRLMDRLDARDPYEVGYGLFQIARDRKNRKARTADQASTPRYSANFSDNDGITPPDGSLEVRWRTRIPQSSSPNGSFTDKEWSRKPDSPSYNKEHSRRSVTPSSRFSQQLREASSSSSREETPPPPGKRTNRRAKHRSEKHRSHRRLEEKPDDYCLKIIGVFVILIFVLLAMSHYKEPMQAGVEMVKSKCRISG